MKVKNSGLSSYTHILIFVHSSTEWKRSYRFGVRLMCLEGGGCKICTHVAYKWVDWISVFRVHERIKRLVSIKKNGIYIYMYNNSTFYLERKKNCCEASDLGRFFDEPSFWCVCMFSPPSFIIFFFSSFILFLERLCCCGCWEEGLVSQSHRYLLEWEERCEGIFFFS